MLEYYKKMVIYSVWDETLQLKVIENDDLFKQKILVLGIKSLLTFISCNWQTNPKTITLEEYLGFEWNKDVDVLEKLQEDSEPICVNIVHPELFYLASQIFHALYSNEPDDFVSMIKNIVNTVESDIRTI